MTDELQADEGEITLDSNNQESETAESGAELAPAPEGEQDKTEDGKLHAQEKAQKAINKQHAKYREEERKRIAAEDEAKDLKGKLEAIEAEKGEVTIPPIPDAYDENYEEQIKARDEAIMQKATQDAQKQGVLNQQNANEEAAVKAENDRFQAIVAGYGAQVTKLGLNADEIRVAGDTVVKNGIDTLVVEYILGDEDGPLITKYLADNPVIQDDLRNLPPIQAAMKINSEIRIAASTMKPQASNAPDPAETLTGRGAGEQKHPLIAGAKFE